jgi:hypothetical protein
MCSPRESWFLIIVYALGLYCQGCSGKERALELVLRDDKVLPFVTNWSGSQWGLHVQLVTMA